MSERDTQIQRDVGVDVDVGIDETREESTDNSQSWLRSKAGSVGSSQALLVSTVLTFLSAFVLSNPLPKLIGMPLGILLAGVLYGGLASEQRYLEQGVAGAITGGVLIFLGNIVMTFLGAGIPMVLFGAAVGLAVGVVGHYFGRDLREGITRDV